MNTAAINSQIIHRENNNGVIKKKKDFHTQLWREFLSEYRKARMTNFRVPRELRMALRKIIVGKAEEPLAKRYRPNKQCRCDFCSRSRDRKTKYVCEACRKFLCLELATTYCQNCAHFTDE